LFCSLVAAVVAEDREAVLVVEPEVVECCRRSEPFLTGSDGADEELPPPPAFDDFLALLLFSTFTLREPSGTLLVRCMPMVIAFLDCISQVTNPVLLRPNSSTRDGVSTASVCFRE